MRWREIRIYQEGNSRTLSTRAKLVILYILPTNLDQWELLQTSSKSTGICLRVAALCLLHSSISDFDC